MKLTISLLTISALGLTASDYPAKDTLAGNPKPEWVNKYLRQGGNVQNSQDADIISCSVSNSWGLTFDDGPSEFTPIVLDELAKRNWKATFFVVGSRVLERPDLLQRAHREGHQIALHTWSHADLTKLTNEQIVGEIMWNAQIVKDAIGVIPKLVRAPFGSIDDRVRGVLKRMGMQNAHWSRDTNDWNNGDVIGQFNNWVKQKRADISLQHDLYSRTVKFVPEVLNILQSARYNVQPVHNCIGRTDYYFQNMPEPSSGNGGIIPTQVKPVVPPATETATSTSNTSAPTTSTTASASSSSTSSSSSTATATSTSISSAFSPNGFLVSVLIPIIFGL